MNPRVFRIALLVVAATPATAHAYLDPGTVYAALQPLLVALAGVTAALTLYRDRLFGWLGIKKKRAQDPPQEGAADETLAPDQTPGDP